MKVVRYLKGAMVAMACATWLVPTQAVFAAPPTKADSIVKRQSGAIRDVELDKSGRLAGQIVDAQGKPAVSKKVLVRDRNQRMTEVKTNQKGWFAVDGLRGGLYEVITPYGVAFYRCWTNGTAPPVASKQVLIVSNQVVKRGQYGQYGPAQYCPEDCSCDQCSPRTGRLKPVLLGLAIAAAVSIPIAIHNSNDDDDPPTVSN